MSQQVTKISLQTQGFPLLSNLSGRGVFIPGTDTPPTIAEPASYVLKPQVIFAENVLPTKEGFRTFASKSRYSAATGYACTEAVHFQVTKTALAAFGDCPAADIKGVMLVGENSQIDYLLAGAPTANLSLLGSSVFTNPTGVTPPATLPALTFATNGGQSYIAGYKNPDWLVPAPVTNAANSAITSKKCNVCVTTIYAVSFAAGSTTITAVGASIANWVAGQSISSSSAAIPAGTSILSIAGDVVTLSAATTAASSVGETVTVGAPISPSYAAAGYYAPVLGLPVSFASLKQALATQTGTPGNYTLVLSSGPIPPELKAQWAAIQKGMVLWNVATPLAPIIGKVAEIGEHNGIYTATITGYSGNLTGVQAVVGSIICNITGSISILAVNYTYTVAVAVSLTGSKALGGTGTVSGSALATKVTLNYMGNPSNLQCDIQVNYAGTVDNLLAITGSYTAQIVLGSIRNTLWTTNHYYVTSGGFSTATVNGTATLSSNVAVSQDFTFVSQVPAGTNFYNLTPVQGITASCGYNIAWTKDSICWSNPTNELDFTPSLITGAGKDTPIDLTGDIIVCYPATNGFFIFSTREIISAQYSGNSLNPWIYSSVSGSGTIRNHETVSHDMVDAQQLAWTTSGLVQLTTNRGDRASPISPEISDFLAAKKIESFNGTTGQLAVTSIPTITDEMEVRITRIGPRYTVISYGFPTANFQVFSHAMIFDMALKRWGKIKLDHTDCFALPAETTAALESMAFLNYAGGLTTITQIMETGGTAEVAGTLVLGRISATRGNAVTLLSTMFERAVSLVCFGSRLLDGGNQSAPVALPLNYSSNGIMEFGARQTGLAHLLSYTGNFEAVDISVKTTQGGDR